MEFTVTVNAETKKRMDALANALNLAMTGTTLEWDVQDVAMLAVINGIDKMEDTYADHLPR